jgi:hypothetical protein
MASMLDLSLRNQQSLLTLRIQDADIFVRFELASPRQPESQPEGTGQNNLRLE